jgi:aspartate/methionine/tyrosine aminotransferase
MGNIQFDNLQLAKAIEHRKKLVKAAIVASGYKFGNDSTLGDVIIDAFHGEMHYGADSSAAIALNEAWKDIISENQKKYIAYTKKQPESLQLLAISRLFERLTHSQINGISDININHQDIVVIPYSSTRLLIEALICRPKKDRDIALCPEGYYKGNAKLAANCGLRIQTFPVDLANDGVIIPEILDNCLTDNKNRTAILWMTMPGNPLIARYSKEQLEQIAKIVVKHNTDVFIDMLFDKMVPMGDYIPFPNIQINDEQGQPHLMYDRTLIIAGNSKNFNATGPWKMGAAISGNTSWLAETRERVSAVTFQRETTHLIYAGTANTSDDYIRHNQQDMMNKQQIVDKRINRINNKLGKEVLISYGKPKYGPFRGLGLTREFIEKAGIKDSWQFADFLLVGAGIESVEFILVGIGEIGVRINIACPRIRGDKNPDNLFTLFERLEYFIREIEAGLTYDDALKRINLNKKVSLQKFATDRQKTVLSRRS